MKILKKVGKICFLFAAFFLPLFATITSHAYAVTTEIGDVANAGDFASKLMLRAQPILLAFAGIMIIIAGYYYITSQGNPESIKIAKDIIIGVVMGLALLYLAGLLFNTIGVNLTSTPIPVGSPTPTPSPSESWGPPLP